MTIKIHKFVTSRTWFLFLHDTSELKSPYDWDSFPLFESFDHSISFAYQSFKLLKSPYSTDCIDYKSDTQYVSRKDCIRKCKLKNSIEKCGVVSHEVQVFKKEPNIRFGATEEDFDCIKNISLDTICLKECPNLDCFKTYYRIINTAKYELDNTQNMLAIEFVTPTDPETIIIHRPAIDMLEFICYIASTVSLWFGLSIISVFSWINSQTIKLYQTINFKPNIILRGARQSKLNTINVMRN